LHSLKEYEGGLSDIQRDIRTQPIGIMVIFLTAKSSGEWRAKTCRDLPTLEVHNKLDMASSPSMSQQEYEQNKSSLASGPSMSQQEYEQNKLDMASGPSMSQQEYEQNKWSPSMSQQEYEQDKSNMAGGPSMSQQEYEQHKSDVASSPSMSQQEYEQNMSNMVGGPSNKSMSRTSKA